MARVITVTNQKGGVGKTTTAINLGAALALEGNFVLLIDIDPQANASAGLGVDFEKVKHSIYEVMQNRISPREIVHSTAISGLKVIPATNDLAGAGVEMVNVPRREYLLAEAVLELRNEYDYIIIDSPPSLGLLTINGLVAADKVLIPVQCEYYALEGLSQLLKTIELVKQRLHNSLDIAGAVLTMHDKRTRLSKDVIREVRDHFPYHVFNSIIPRNVRLAEAPSFGKTIFEQAKYSAGARAYYNLARELRIRDLAEEKIPSTNFNQNING
ncbi:MAG: AAA family ATPase [bacterium]